MPPISADYRFTVTGPGRAHTECSSRHRENPRRVTTTSLSRTTNALSSDIGLRKRGFRSRKDDPELAPSSDDSSIPMSPPCAFSSCSFEARSSWVSVPIGMRESVPAGGQASGDASAAGLWSVPALSAGRFWGIARFIHVFEGEP